MIQIKNGLQILVLDVDEDYANSVGNILSEAGANTLLANNAKDGMELFKKITPEIVITDLRLDGKSGTDEGIDLIQSFRNIVPGFFCIVVTSYPDTRLSRDNYQLGINYLLIKPCSPERILYAVDKGIELLETRRNLNILKKLVRETQKINSISVN